MSSHHQDFSPLVSVVIPAYNAERFIERTLHSVLSQTYKNLEVIVVDDGSQDRTSEIVKAAQQDSRLRLLKQLNSGVAAARNLAIQQSQGEFIAPIDADDTWYPQNLEKQVQCLVEADPSVGLVYSWSVEIDENDLLKGGFHAADYQGNIYTKLLYHNFIGNASAILIRRCCFEKIGGYNCELKAQNAQGCEDWDLYLRVAEHYRVRVVPEFLVGYRQVSNSMSRNYSLMAKSQYLVLESARKKYPEIPAAVYRWSISNFYVYLASLSSKDNNPIVTLSFLYKALKLDASMAFLRHNLYLMIIQEFLKILLQHRLSALNPQISPKSLTLSDIDKLRTIRSFSPAKVYKEARVKGLLSSVNIMPNNILPR